MRKLMLDYFGLLLQLLVQDRSCHRPKAVTGNFRPSVIAQTPKSRIDSGIAHWTLGRTCPRKYVTTVAGQRVKLSQNLNSLGCERNQMLGLGLRNKVPPLTLIEIELSPLGLAELTGPSE
ncbi:Uncharacterised protein [Burkholderia pseudomallei]|nr:Uncharacterised protein [Burkholderia pseudomallei]